jgi:2-polyprenyl-3-methyl-5-hydroxy-6-metoxy-1,4-benzoquinol methylase
MNELKEKQYYNSEKLEKRGNIHQLFGTNKQRWVEWLFDQYSIPANAKIIEFGCGTGSLWLENIDSIDKSWNVVLSDFSEGMIQKAKKSLSSFPSFCFEIIDLNTVNDIHGIFDIIIANHMLYHLDNVEKALANFKEIMGEKATLYASTFGDTNMLEMRPIIKGFTGNNKYENSVQTITSRFSLESGEIKLRNIFSSVNKILYEDVLKITEAIPLAEYILSVNDIVPGVEIIQPNAFDELVKYLNKLISNKGFITISKSVGTFIATK